MTTASLPKPRLLLPRYTDAQVFRVISAFLSRREFTFTQSMLAKEAVAKGLVGAGDGDGDDELDEEALGEHLAFLLAQLTDEGGEDGAGEEDETGNDAGHLERVAEDAGGDEEDDDDEDNDEEEDDGEDEDEEFATDAATEATEVDRKSVEPSSNGSRRVRRKKTLAEEAAANADAPPTEDDAIGDILADDEVDNLEDIEVDESHRTTTKAESTKRTSNAPSNKPLRTATTTTVAKPVHSNPTVAEPAASDAPTDATGAITNVGGSDGAGEEDEVAQLRAAAARTRGGSGNGGGRGGGVNGGRGRGSRASPKPEPPHGSQGSMMNGGRRPSNLGGRPNGGFHNGPPLPAGPPPMGREPPHMHSSNPNPAQRRGPPPVGRNGGPGPGMGGRGPMPRNDPPPRAFPPMDDPGWGHGPGRGRGPPMRGGGRGPPPGPHQGRGGRGMANGGRGQKRKMAGGY